MIYTRYIKRILDIIISLFAIIIASPVLLVVGILVRCKLGAPIVFTQKRTGYKTKPFRIYKFRSMTSETDDEGKLLPDEERITKFGLMLRATSLDELPEIFNILKGDMSLIGPRPLLPTYVDLYSPRQIKRHEVRPGLTGLAQVNGRNAISWEEKFEFDLEYANNISFWMDIRIFFLTIKKVFFKEDIQSENEVTSTVFQGTKKQRFGSKHKKVIRILFTSVGRRVELIQTFMYSANELGIDLVTYGADPSSKSPALLRCSHFIVTHDPTDERYPEQILSYCQMHKIDMVIPLSLEDKVLSEHINAFAKKDIRILGSDKGVVDMCMDKKRVVDYFFSCNVHTVRPVENYMDYEEGYPAVVEVHDPQLGILSNKVENEKDLQYYMTRNDVYLIRPYVEGDFYEIDVFCDFHGQPIFITPMRKETKKRGEIVRYRISHDEKMILEAKAIIDAIRPVGPLTISAVKSKTNGNNYFVGMRPVFSENVTITIKAGADSPKALLKLLCGEATPYQAKAANEGILFSRIEQSVQIKEESNMVFTFHKFNELYNLGEDVEAVVFDLDDTLFSQKEYMRSGLKVLSEMLPEIHNCYNRMSAAFEQGKLPVETVLKEEGLDKEQFIRSCLDFIIIHEPDIHFYPGVEDLFLELRRQKKMIAIITDGKPVQQRNKINALGLKELVDEIIITDELAGNGDVHAFRKPNDLAYIIMRNRLGIPLRNMVYVGEDPKIDFKAPGKLGMKCYQYVNDDRLYDDKW